MSGARPAGVLVINTLCPDSQDAYRRYVIVVALYGLVLLGSTHRPGPARPEWSPGCAPPRRSP